MIYAFEDFEFDREAYELRRAGKLVTVEPQVFEVLGYLLARRDRLVPKEELLDEVWGTRFVTESALTTRIKEARRALDDDGRTQRLIRTVTGRGYRFVGDAAERGAAIDGEPATATAIAAGPGDEPAPPLLGRDRELGELDEALAAAVAGRRRVVLVSGDAGAGKTSLLDAFASRAARSSGALVATGQSIEHAGSTEPYLPLLDALSRLCRGSGGRDVIAILRRSAPTWLLQLPGLVHEDEFDALQRRALGATGARMSRELLEALEELSGRRPVVVLLEDLHWADTATLELVAACSRRSAGARLLVVATYRPGASGDAGLDTLVAELVPRRPVCRLVEVGGLGVEAAPALLESRWGAASVSPALVDLVVERSGGNPLFMTALADHWLATGLISVGDGGGVVLPSGLDALAATVPLDLRRLIEHQASALPPADREVLDAASIAGRHPGAVAVAAAALDIDDEEAEQRLAALADRSALLVRGDDTGWPDGTTGAGFGFRHSLYQQVVYERVPPLRRARAHARIGARLADTFGLDDPAHAGEIARHLTAGGDTVRAVPALVAASKVALRRSGHLEAVELLAQARTLVERMEDDGTRDRWEAEVLALLAPSLIATRGWAADEARAAYERVVELCRRLPDPELLDTVMYGLATLHEYRAEYDRSQQLMEERLQLGADAAPPGRVEAYELLACSSFHQGNFQAALDHTDRVLAAYDPDEHLGLMALHGENPAVSTRHWAALALWFLGYPERARRTMDDALALAADHAHSFSLAHAHEHAAYLFQHRGEPDEVRRHAEAAVRLADEAGYVYRHATGTMMHGWAVAASDPEAGLAELADGLAAYRATGAAMDLPYFLALRAEVLLRLGRLGEASATLDEAVAVQPPDRRYYYEPELLRLRAELLHRSGHAEQARAAAQRGIDAARALGARSLELRTALTLVAHAGDGPEIEAARGALRTAYEAFDEGFDTPELRRAAHVLASA